MTDFNLHLRTKRPTIYADMNIFRYFACDDILITKPERFIWVYSETHMDEIFRSKSKNKDALKGMEMLKAVEIWRTEDKGLLPTDDPKLCNYTNPFERYDRYAKEPWHYESTSDFKHSLMRYLFGADNYEELKGMPDKIYEDLTRSLNNSNDKEREGTLEKLRANREANKKVIESCRKHHESLEELQKEAGLTSEKRKKIERADSPIHKLLKTLNPSNPDTSKNQFLRSALGDDSKSIKDMQGFAACHLHCYLNACGIFPDEALPNKEKIKKTMSDNEHTMMASYCNALASSDKLLCGKARSIYTFIENTTKVLDFKYKKPKFNIEIKSDKTLELISNCH